VFQRERHAVSAPGDNYELRGVLDVVPAEYHALLLAYLQHSEVSLRSFA
jgi:hypothetical protein